TLLAGSLPSFRDGGAAGFAFPFLLAALGAAALPHLLARTLSAASVRDAATSMIWGAMLAIVAILAGLVLMQLLIAAAGEDAPIGADLVQSAAIFTALPAALAGLVLAGTLAALFALGQAALFAAATTLSHDVWDESVDRKG